MDILEIQGVSKRYTSVMALDDVTMSVEPGCILGLLGPNGAGKTTLLRIINGLLTIDAGSVTVAGKPASLDTSRHIGYMPEERGLYDNMSVEKQIMFFGTLKDGDPKRMREVMNEYIELFNLKGQEKRRVKELSKGNQQKVQIIATLVHEPELVILDEPFSGFDPINGALLQELIERLHKRGATIILSSHNMPAVEEMCSHIALINHGKLLVHGRLDDVKESNKTDDLLLTVAQPLNEKLAMASGHLVSIQSDELRNGRKGYAYRLKKHPGVANGTILTDIALQAEILHFEEALPSLNEIFLRYTAGNTPASEQNAEPLTNS